MPPRLRPADPWAMLLLAAALTAAMIAVGATVVRGAPAGSPGPAVIDVGRAMSSEPLAGPGARSRADDGYRPPVEPAVVRAQFRAPADPWGPGHRGIDIDTEPGTPVHAPAGGVITFSGVVVDRGVLTIAHADGLRSSLEPVHDAVPVGTEVAAGDVVAVVGSGATHCAPSPCLHWGVRSGDAYLDPLELLPGSGPVVLVPVP